MPLQISDCKLQIEHPPEEWDLQVRLRMDPEGLKRRTKEFALEVMKLCRRLPSNREGFLVGDQLFRSSTSLAANYRAACRGRSKAEFLAKLGIVLEEAEESMFWLELLAEMGISDCAKVEALLREANELTAIVVASLKTARRGR